MLSEWHTVVLHSLPQQGDLPLREIKCALLSELTCSDKKYLKAKVYFLFLFLIRSENGTYNKKFLPALHTVTIKISLRNESPSVYSFSDH